MPLTACQAWIGRVLAPNRSEEFGYQLHPVDLVTNALLQDFGRAKSPGIPMLSAQTGAGEEPRPISGGY